MGLRCSTVQPGDLERRSVPLILVDKMADNDSQLDLGALSDDALVEQMHDDLYDGLKEEVEEGVRILLERKWTPYNTLTKGLVEGMRIVGIDFRDGILFVPEVLLAPTP